MNKINLPLVGTKAEANAALDVLTRHFDIADVSERESNASLDYTQSRVAAARQALDLNPNARERVIYRAWLDFFDEKIAVARATKAMS